MSDWCFVVALLRTIKTGPHAGAPRAAYVLCYAIAMHLTSRAWDSSPTVQQHLTVY
jgi:hypothetical protein